MNLRPYQHRALGMARDAYRKGARRILVVSPVGSGKTTIGSEACRVHVAQGGCVLWLAHRRELVKQAAERLEAFGLEVGYSGLRESAPVQVRTVQGVMRRGEAPAASLVVADEAHHFVEGNDWRRALDAYPDAMVLGLTATPERADGRGLGGEGGFQALVVAVQVGELQREGLLSRVELIRAPRPLKPGQVARSPREAYLAHAPGELAVVFALHLRDAEAFRADFERFGVAVAIVSGKTPKDERDAILRRWAAGEIRVVVNCNVLTEGFDLPAISCVIIARGCSSAGQLIQMAGRGMRMAAGKERCLVLDLRGVTWTLGRPDADADFSLDGFGIHMRGSPTIRLCSFCGLAECGCEGRGAELTRSLDIELVPWEARYAAAKELVKPSRAALCLAGIMRKADEAAKRGKPWKQSAIVFRYRAIMKRLPSDVEWAQAEAVNREARRGVA